MLLEPYLEDSRVHREQQGLLSKEIDEPVSVLGASMEYHMKQEVTVRHFFGYPPVCREDSNSARTWQMLDLQVLTNAPPQNQG